MKLPALILLELVTICLFSCNPKNKQLAEIDSIIESNPNGAFQSLQKIQRKALSAKDYPYYCLLYTQAQIKNDIIVTSDSLIRIPYEIYRREESGDLKRRACFYNAQILYYQRNLGAAMKDALEAYEISEAEKNYNWMAKSAELMADIFYEAYNYDESEVWTIATVKYYKQAGNELNHRYALCDLASVYLNLNKDNEATTIIDSLINVVNQEEPLDSALSEFVMTVKYSALIKQNKQDELREGVPQSIQNSPNDWGVDVSIMKSYLLNMEGETEASDNLLLETYNFAADEKERIRIMYELYRHALEQEDYRKAALMADSLLLIQSNISREMLRESVTGIQRDFYSQKAKYQERKSTSLYRTLIAVIVIALIITALLVVIYQLKIKAKKSELVANISSLMSIKQQIETVSTENERLSVELTDKTTVLNDLREKLNDNTKKNIQNRAVIEYLFKEKWGTLNMLCNEYFEMGDSEATRNALLNRIEKEIKKLGSKKNLKDIEVAVDLYIGDIMKLMREECNFLKEDDFVFLSLIYAGLSVRAVCMLTGMKYKHYYLKKSRLTKRIESSSAPHKEFLLEKLR